MKYYLRALICALILSVIGSLVPFQNSCEELNSDVFRVHMVPNSNSAFDQNLKLSVRDAVLFAVSPLYDDVSSKEDAMRITRENLSLVEKVAKDAIKKDGADYRVQVSVENTYFNTRYYDGFTMPAGYYDALRLVIGEGRGDNFWCVMYPSLCVGSATRKKLKEDLGKEEYKVVTSDDLEFRFKIVEYYERIRAQFR